MGKIKYDKRNYRKHNERNKELIRKSLTECGAGRSVLLDADDSLIAGNGVFEQAEKLGIPVRVIETDGSELIAVKRTDIGENDEKRRRLALADNATSDSSEWDVAAITADLSPLELEQWDITMPEVAHIALPQEHEEYTEDDFDESVDNIERRVSFGDIWQLGEHRLMCGDSTDDNCVSRLMDGKIADICVTSPPYNAWSIDQKGNEGTHKKYNEYDDNKSGEEYFQFLKKNLGLMLKNAAEVFYNIGLVSGNKREIVRLQYEYLNNYKDVIYWEKSTVAPMIVKGAINNLVEFILCFGRNNTRRFENAQFGQGTYFNVIKGPNASGNEYAAIHKATFPVYLPANIISNFSPVGGSVIECFGGTGTTLIACEQLGRKCYIMELDTRYCDVILARWEKLTGKKAVKL